MHIQPKNRIVYAVRDVAIKELATMVKENTIHRKTNLLFGIWNNFCYFAFNIYNALGNVFSIPYKIARMPT